MLKLVAADPDVVAVLSESPVDPGRLWALQPTLLSRYASVLNSAWRVERAQQRATEAAQALGKTSPGTTAGPVWKAASSRVARRVSTAVNAGVARSYKTLASVQTAVHTAAVKAVEAAQAGKKAPLMAKAAAAFMKANHAALPVVATIARVAKAVSPIAVAVGKVAVPVAAGASGILAAQKGETPAGSGVRALGQAAVTYELLSYGLMKRHPAILAITTVEAVFFDKPHFTGALNVGVQAIGVFADLVFYGREAGLRGMVRLGDDVVAGEHGVPMEALGLVGTGITEGIGYVWDFVVGDTTPTPRGLSRAR
jgi:hypothetical protein